MSTYKDIDNIYPLFFSNYDMYKELEDPKLNALKQQYEMGYPLRHLELYDNKIKLVLNADAGYEYILIFTYSVKEDDWLLEEYIEHYLNDDEKKDVIKDLKNTSISKFSYADFIQGRY